MHLKSLTLKGFKSFASPTTLRFEPGITCVVGPNGSGKSNVVDALTWVMGEQGAKTLRGGKMEDVIFAGTSTRAPLGRAEVTVTIDNSDNALPIEYSEVSITRRMFRDGASEYEINGSSCRLMDVQELLSDSGIGREMHVIVGQGKLSEILESRPEDRRAFIEEAAGVLKHRKRKEKAVRKLDSMSANLARLTDLTTELRRQLKPLGRQAEMARRAQTIQADLRDARLRLAADDLTTRQAEFNDTNQTETMLRREHDELATRMDEAALELTTHETAVAGLTGRAEAAQQTWFRLSALAERVSATVRIATERAQLLDAEPEASAGTDPEALEAEAEQVAEHERELIAELAHSRELLEANRSELAERERLAAEAERAHVAAVRAEADRREGLARLAGQVDTMRTRVESIDESVARLSVGIEDAANRTQQAKAEFETVQGRVGELDAGEAGLDENHDRSVTSLRLADERVTELQAGERNAERQVASLRARIDALAVGLDRRDGAAWLQKNHGGTGLFGSVAKLVRVRPGYEIAVAAVLGSAADALAADDFGAARSAVAALKAADGGRAAIVLGDWPEVQAPQRDQLPEGAAWAFELVDVPGRLRGALSAMLANVVVVRDLADRARPGGIAATVEGRHRRRRPGRRGLGERRLRPQAEHAGDHVGDREGAHGVGGLGAPGERDDRRAVGCAHRAVGPPRCRRTRACRAQRVRCRDLVDLRATGSTRAGRPRRRGRMAAADAPAGRARGESNEHGRGADRTRDPAAQRAAVADVRGRADGPPGNGDRRRGSTVRRGRGPVGRTHRGGTRERRSGPGGFAAPRRRHRTGEPTARPARAGGP